MLLPEEASTAPQQPSNGPSEEDATGTKKDTTVSSSTTQTDPSTHTTTTAPVLRHQINHLKHWSRRQQKASKNPTSAAVTSDRAMEQEEPVADDNEALPPPSTRSMATTANVDVADLLASKRAYMLSRVSSSHSSRSSSTSIVHHPSSLDHSKSDTVPPPVVVIDHPPVNETTVFVNRKALRTAKKARRLEGKDAVQPAVDDAPASTADAALVGDEKNDPSPFYTAISATDPVNKVETNDLMAERRAYLALVTKRPSTARSSSVPSQRSATPPLLLMERTSLATAVLPRGKVRNSKTRRSAIPPPLNHNNVPVSAANDTPQLAPTAARPALKQTRSSGTTNSNRITNTAVSMSSAEKRNRAKQLISTARRSTTPSSLADNTTSNNNSVSSSSISNVVVVPCLGVNASNSGCFDFPCSDPDTTRSTTAASVEQSRIVPTLSIDTSIVEAVLTDETHAPSEVLEIDETVKAGGEDVTTSNAVEYTKTSPTTATNPLEPEDIHLDETVEVDVDDVTVPNPTVMTSNQQEPHDAQQTSSADQQIPGDVQQTPSEEIPLDETVEAVVDHVVVSNAIVTTSNQQEPDDAQQTTSEDIHLDETVEAVVDHVTVPNAIVMTSNQQEPDDAQQTSSAAVATERPVRPRTPSSDSRTERRIAQMVKIRSRTTTVTPKVSTIPNSAVTINDCSSTDEIDPTDMVVPGKDSAENVLTENDDKTMILVTCGSAMTSKEILTTGSVLSASANRDDDKESNSITTTLYDDLGGDVHSGSKTQHASTPRFPPEVEAIDKTAAYRAISNDEDDTAADDEIHTCEPKVVVDALVTSTVLNATLSNTMKRLDKTEILRASSDEEISPIVVVDKIATSTASNASIFNPAKGLDKTAIVRASSGEETSLNVEPSSLDFRPLMDHFRTDNTTAVVEPSWDASKVLFNEFIEKSSSKDQLNVRSRDGDILTEVNGDKFELLIPAPTEAFELDTTAKEMDLDPLGWPVKLDGLNSSAIQNEPQNIEEVAATDGDFDSLLPSIEHDNNFDESEMVELASVEPSMSKEERIQQYETIVRDDESSVEGEEDNTVEEFDDEEPLSYTLHTGDDDAVDIDVSSVEKVRSVPDSAPAENIPFATFSPSAKLAEAEVAGNSTEEILALPLVETSQVESVLEQPSAIESDLFLHQLTESFSSLPPPPPPPGSKKKKSRRSGGSRDVPLIAPPPAEKMQKWQDQKAHQIDRLEKMKSKMESLLADVDASGDRSNETSLPSDGSNYFTLEASETIHAVISNEIVENISSINKELKFAEHDSTFGERSGGAVVANLTADDFKLESIPGMHSIHCAHNTFISSEGLKSHKPDSAVGKLSGEVIIGNLAATDDLKFESFPVTHAKGIADGTCVSSEELKSDEFISNYGERRGGVIAAEVTADGEVAVPLETGLTDDAIVPTTGIDFADMTNDPATLRGVFSNLSTPTGIICGYDKATSDDEREQTSKLNDLTSAFADAIMVDPTIISVILDFLGDPVAVCRMKMLNRVCFKYIDDNEHRLMRDAVRLGGMNMSVRPSFWLWVTLCKGQSATCTNSSENSVRQFDDMADSDLSRFERQGREGKWFHVIGRDVSRAFGTLPPHKTGARLRTDSIVRALVTWGRSRMMQSGVKGARDKPVLPDSAPSDEASISPTDTVSDWGGVTPVGSFNGSFTSSNSDPPIAGAEHGTKSSKHRHKKQHMPDDMEFALGTNTLTETMKVTLQQKLSYILHALAAAHPEVGYCQGMDYLVAHLLRMLQETIRWQAVHGNLPAVIQSAPSVSVETGRDLSDIYAEIDRSLVVEETCFRVMNSFFTTYSLQHFYWPELRCLKTCCRVFEKIIQLKLPVLADHFEHHELNVGLFALGWFQTLFLYLPSMPSATVCHMWDIWLVERSFKIFFRVGTAILFLSQPILLNHELEGMMGYLNTFPDATLLSPDILIACSLQIKITNRMLMEIEKEIQDSAMTC